MNIDRRTVLKTAVGGAIATLVPWVALPKLRETYISFYGHTPVPRLKFVRDDGMDFNFKSTDQLKLRAGGIDSSDRFRYFAMRRDDI